MRHYLFLLPISITYHRLSGAVYCGYCGSSLSSSCPLHRVYIETLELHSQSSRSFNTHTAKLTVMTPDRTTCWAINLLPHSRSHYFYYLCKCLELLHLSNERTVDPNRITSEPAEVRWLETIVSSITRSLVKHYNCLFEKLAPFFSTKIPMAPAFNAQPK